MIYTCHPSTQEIEIGGLRAQSQLGLHYKALPQNKTRVGEMTQQVKILVAKADDLSSALRTHYGRRERTIHKIDINTKVLRILSQPAANTPKINNLRPGLNPYFTKKNKKQTCQSLEAEVRFSSVLRNGHTFATGSFVNPSFNKSEEQF